MPSAARSRRRSWATRSKNARRTIPRALIAAGFIITAGYILGTIAVLVALPKVNSLEGIMQAISSSADRVGWTGLGPAVALLICVSILGGVGAYLAALSRIPFVAGIDRFLPPAFGRVHPKWGTPYISLIVQALCCARVYPDGPIRQHGPWRLPGAGEHDHHHQLRAISVHVRSDDSPATRAG